MPIEDSHFAYRLLDGDMDFVRGLPLERLPTISAIIPSYNQAKYLPDTIDSVLAQNYPKLDIFVADGGSKDDSPKILEDYRQKHPDIFRYVSERDGGQKFAINKGLAATQGEIVAWINSDDVYYPETFWKIVTAFTFNRSALVIYGRNHYTDSDLNVLMEHQVRWAVSTKENRRRMMHQCLIPQPSLFFKRAAVEIGGNVDCAEVVDYEMWLRWQKQIPFFFFDEVLSKSRLHDDAKTVAESCQMMIKICDFVHRHYRMVPFTWTQAYVYHKRHGAVWMKKDPPPITKSIRWEATRLWYWLNLKYLPRAIGSYAKEIYRLLREGYQGY